MTPAEFRSIRQRLGLSQSQLARVLAYARANMIAYFESEAASAREVPVHVAMLMHAFDAGYRPQGWPG
jgi:hypothetical protein